MFIIPADDLGSRLEAGLANLLNTVAYKWFISDHLPNVPYLTLMDIFIYGALLMNVAVLAEAIVVVYAFCELDTGTGKSEMWECDLSAMHAFEREFSWPLLRYWIGFNMLFVLISISHREYLLEGLIGRNHPFTRDEKSRKVAGNSNPQKSSQKTADHEEGCECSRCFADGRAYFTAAYNKISLRRTQAIRALRILEQVVDNREKDKDGSARDRDAVWWKNVKRNEDNVFRRQIGLQLVNRVCRTKAVCFRRGCILSSRPPLRKFEIQCYIWSLSGRSHTEPSNGRLHWLARSVHWQEIVSMLLRDTDGDTFKIQASGAMLEGCNARETKCLSHLMHARSLAAEDAETPILYVRGNALQNNDGSFRVKVLSGPANSNEETIHSNGEHKVGLELSRRLEITLPKTRESAAVHCDIMATAAIMQYLLLHSRSENITVQKMHSNMRTESVDGKVAPVGKGHKVVLWPDSYEFSAEDGAASTFHMMNCDKKTNSNFFVKLKAAVYACDIHWSDEQPNYWSVKNARRSSYQSVIEDTAGCGAVRCGRCGWWLFWSCVLTVLTRVLMMTSWIQRPVATSPNSWAGFR